MPLSSFTDNSGENELTLLIKGQFLKHSRDILFRKGYRQENEYRLEHPRPVLSDLSIVLEVICRLHLRYTLHLVRYFIV